MTLHDTHRSPLALTPQLLHAAARHADAAMVTILLHAGATAAIADDCGKTPLHDACWRSTASPDIICLLIDQHAQLVMAEDRLGAIPLDYVPASDVPVIAAAVSSKLDQWWKPVLSDIGAASAGLTSAEPEPACPAHEASLRSTHPTALPRASDVATHADAAIPPVKLADAQAALPPVETAVPSSPS